MKYNTLNIDFLLFVFFFLLESLHFSDAGSSDVLKVKGSKERTLYYRTGLSLLATV